MIRFALVLAVVAFANRAAADPAAAERIAGEAAQAFSTGDFKTAATKFAEAHKEDPSRPELFCNIGISYFKAGELPRAHLLLQQCIERTALELTFKDNAKAVLTQIEGTLRAENHTPVTIRVTPQGATTWVTELGAESGFVGARTIWLPFGTHHLQTRIEGYKERATTVETSDQNPKTVEITLEKEAVVVPPPVTPKPKPPTKILPIATTTVTVGAIVLAAVAFSNAHTAADRGPFALDDEALRKDKNETKKWNRVMAISGAASIVGAAASVYLWRRVVTWRAPTLEVAPTPGGAKVSLGLRF